MLSATSADVEGVAEQPANNAMTSSGRNLCVMVSSLLSVPYTGGERRRVHNGTAAPTPSMCCAIRCEGAPDRRVFSNVQTHISHGRMLGTQARDDLARAKKESPP